LTRLAVYVVAFLIVGTPRFVVAALTGTVAPLAVMMTFEGLACGAINPILATAIYQSVPHELRSRMLSATTASALLIAPLGGLAAGFLAGAVGVAAALLAVGGIYLLVTLYPAASRRRRKLDCPGSHLEAIGQKGVIE
jgi:MFS family permease